MLISLEKVRQEPKERRRLIALVAAGIVVGIIFIVWITTFTTKLSDTQTLEEEREYKPTIAESIKRKAELLFGDLEVPQIGSPVEYKQSKSEPSEQSLAEKTGIASSTEEASLEDLIQELIDEDLDVKSKQ